MNEWFSRNRWLRLPTSVWTNTTVTLQAQLYPGEWLMQGSRSITNQASKSVVCCEVVSALSLVGMDVGEIFFHPRCCWYVITVQHDMMIFNLNEQTMRLQGWEQSEDSKWYKDYVVGKQSEAKIWYTMQTITEQPRLSSHNCQAGCPLPTSSYNRRDRFDWAQSSFLSIFFCHQIETTHSKPSASLKELICKPVAKNFWRAHIHATAHTLWWRYLVRAIPNADLRHKQLGEESPACPSCDVPQHYCIYGPLSQEIRSMTAVFFCIILKIASRGRKVCSR